MSLESKVDDELKSQGTYSIWEIRCSMRIYGNLERKFVRRMRSADQIHITSAVSEHMEGVFTAV